MSQATLLKAAVDRSIDRLFTELDHAQRAADTVAADTANAEIDKLVNIAADLQFTINQGIATRLDAFADRIEASIQRQTAAGLFRAATLLASAVNSTTGRVISVPRPPAPLPPPVSPAPNPTPAPSPPIAPPITLPENPATPPGVPVPLPNTLRARPGPNRDCINKLISQAEKSDLDPISVLTIVAIESDFDATATNPNSSAAGLFQFIDSTWLAAGGERFPGRGGKGNGYAAGATEKVQIVLGCRHTAANRFALEQALGQPPTPTQLYMAHQQGQRGALRLLAADRRSAIESVIGVAAARHNQLSGLSVAEGIAHFGRLVARHLLEVREQVETIANDGSGKAAPTTRDTPPPLAGDPSPFRDKAADAARAEMNTFALKLDGSSAKETEQPLRNRTLEYLRFVELPKVTDPGKVAWSAAFISFVMSQAGASRQQFPFSAAHHSYIRQALKNRIANDPSATLIYHDRSEFAPRIGDLVGRSRTSKVKNRKDIEKLLPDGSFLAHTDIVVRVGPGFIETIGGNVSNSIKKRRFDTTSKGLVKDRKKWFCVLEVNIPA